MDKAKRSIKEYAIKRSVVCLLCCRQYSYNKMLKHSKVVHKEKTTQFGEELTKYSSIKVIHGICKNEKVYLDKKEFLEFNFFHQCLYPLPFSMYDL